MSKYQNSGLFNEDHGKSSVRERLANYMAHWPLFLISMVLCVGAGLLYARYTVPKYIATTKFLIKGAEFGEKNSDDPIEVALSGKRQVNLNNEMLLISSSSLMERTVAKNGFNVSYYRKGKFKTIDIYNDAPFQLLVKEITDSNQTFAINLTKMTGKGGVFLYGPENAKRAYKFKWNMPFVIDGQRFSLIQNGQISNAECNYIVQWQPVKAAAAELLGNFTVNAYDSKTSVILLSIKTNNMHKGRDVLNALFNEFNYRDIEDRNSLSDRTVNFIDERLIGITNELKGVEGSLENYQGSRQLIDIKEQSSQSLNNSSEITKAIKSINIQQGLVAMLNTYFLNPNNGNKLVPSSLGLEDATLSSLIAQYNELKLRREREASQIAPNSPIMLDLNAQIANLKSSIMESLRNISMNLKIQEKSYQQQNNQYRGFLASLPHNERILLEIKRKQSITEGLYLYLLQKREEAAISRTEVNVAHYKQVDPAIAYGPVEPNTRNILMSTIILGLFLPLGCIYLKDLLNEKVLNSKDVSCVVDIPIIGEICHVKKNKHQLLPVLNRSLISEQFRSLRANLSLLTKNIKKQVILVTSTKPGEGKSFVCLNLAAVLAIPGKKVALLEFDLRKPELAEKLQLESSIGLSDYLIGEVDDLSSIVLKHNEIPDLHIYPAGKLVMNPSDLLLSQRLVNLLSILKEDYDHIIIDTPPLGLLSDSVVLSQFCDVVLYIIRQRFTLKKHLEAIRETSLHNEFINEGVVWNDIRNGSGYSYAEFEKSYLKERRPK